MASNTETYLIIFVGLTGLAVLLQAFVLFGIFLSLRKSAKAVQQTTDDLKATIIPVVQSTRELVERIGPQVMSISAEIAELTAKIKKETHGVSFSVSEIMGRVNEQSKRLDAMLTHGLDAVDRASVVVETTVAAPVRQVNGVMAAIRAVIETYRTTIPPRRAAARARASYEETEAGSGI